MKKYIHNLLILLSICSCTNYYEKEDFDKVRKIDMHVHLSTIDTELIYQAIQDNFKLITINTDSKNDSSIIDQERLALIHQKNYPGEVFYITTFSMTNWDSASWSDSVIARINRSIKTGALGVKIWRNIGMQVKDKEGHYIMINNPKFDPIFDYMSAHNIPLAVHISEPRNRWLPADQIKMTSDRNSFYSNPEYSYLNKTDFPDYKAQLNARDQVLDKHPGLIFIGFHLGSMEWDVDEIAKRFEKYPNMSVDIGARLWYLELQAMENWQKVHDFFIKYHNRILYSSDMVISAGQDLEGAKKYIHKIWVHDWQFLVAADTMTSEKFDGSFKGMRLPKDVIDNIYYKNAERVFITHKIIN